MKILHVITKLNEMYGAQRHAVESVKDHLIHGHECMVLAGETGIASGMLEDAGVTVKQATYLKNSYNPVTGSKGVKEVMKVNNYFKPHLVISHSTIAGILTRIACYRKKVPNIFTVQGWPFEIGTMWYQRLLGLSIETMLKHYSDSYLCVSHYTAQYGIKALRLKDTSRIFVCGNMHVNMTDAPLPAFSIHYNVLMVAGFRGQKDHITALKALEKIVQSNALPGLKFTFLGDGPERNKIEDFIRQRNLQQHVVLAGETKNVAAYYDNADIVILPTYYEGLPLSLLEALQRAKPLIATDVGGNREIVCDNVNGNLIRVEDADALAKHIIDYYTSNKLEQLSKASKKIYDEQYSCAKVSERMNYIIERAVHSSRFSQK